MYKGIEIEEIAQLRGLDFMAREVVTGFLTGLHKSPMHGFSVEFAEHRSYNPGDSIRHIDWKLYGKTDKLFVKRYEEETNLRCYFALDASSSMYFPYKEDQLNKLAFSVYSIAALIELMKRQRDAYGLVTYNTAMDVLTESKLGETHLKRIYGELENVLRPKDQGITTNNFDVFHQLAEALPTRSVVIIFTDLMDTLEYPAPFLEAVQHLRHTGREVIIFQVYESDQELELNYTNKLYVFQDSETGEKIRLNPSQMKKSYKEAMEKQLKTIKDEVFNMGADLIQANINEEIEKVLLGYLIKRQNILKK